MFEKMKINILVRMLVVLFIGLAMNASAQQLGENVQVDQDGVANISISIPEGVPQLLNTIAVRENGKIKVYGTDGYWGQDLGKGDAKNSKEAVFDGDDSTFFDPITAENVKGMCWAGIELEKPHYIFKVRYKGRKGGNDGQRRQMTGCWFQGANKADFSDAETFAIADVDKDAPSHSIDGTWTVWNGVNFWAETDVPFIFNASNPFSQVVRNRKAYKFLRIVGPNPYVSSGSANGQNGMCCGNVGELEFYGLPEECANHDEGYNAEEYRPQISGQIAQDNKFTFDMTFHFVTNSATAVMDQQARIPYGSLYGYEVFRETPSADGTSYTSEIVDGGFMVKYPGLDKSTYSFIETNVLPRVRYRVRAFNIAYNTLEAVIVTPKWMISPMDLEITADPRTGVPMISWEQEADGTNLVTGVVVFRGTAPGGPWTRLNEEVLPYSQTSYEDHSLHSGIVYYYRLAYEFADPLNDNVYIGYLSDDVSYMNAPSIERVWNEDKTSSTLKEGMQAICHYKSWDDAGLPINLFDGDTTTFSDIVPEADRTIRDDGTAKAGIDLGREYIITRARIYPRQSGGTNEKNRFSKLALYGSNADSTGADAEDGWRNDANLTKLTERFQNPNPYNSFYEVTITNNTPFRYILIKHADMTDAERGKVEAFANAAELELFGYALDEVLTDVLIAPLKTYWTVFTDNDNPYAQTGLELRWNPSPNAEYYRIDHLPVGSEEWEVVADNLTDTTWFKPSTVFQEFGNYRIVSVRGEEEAWSREIHPYGLGNGTGLWTVYTCPYEKNIHQSKEWIRRVDPTIDYYWGETPIIPECPFSTNDVYLTWSGKIIAPVTGIYNFSVNCDRGFALRINNKQVINNWSGTLGPKAYKGKLYLEAGEHKMRADYVTTYKGGKLDMHCQLKWGGAVNTEIVPQSQLIPEPLPAMSYPWMGERTFESIVKGYSEFTPTTNKVWEVGKDGVSRLVDKEIDGFTITAAGGDFWIKETTAHMVWRMVTGDFLISAKFERQINAQPNQSNDSGWAWKGQLVARKDLGLISPVVCASYASNGFAGRADLKIRDEKGVDIYDYQDRVWNLPPVVYQKLQRVGNIFTQAFSTDGENWEVVKTYEDTYHLMDGILYVGPAVSSILDLKDLGTYKITMVKVESDAGSGMVFVR